MTTTVAANCISQPIVAPRGALVTVTPAVGGTVKVEYTSIDNAPAVRSGAATWTNWPLGTVAAAASDLVSESSYIRVTAFGGAATYDLDERPSATSLKPFTPDWGGALAMSTDSAKSVIGMTGPEGKTVHSLKPGIAAIQRLFGSQNSRGSGTGAGTGNGFIIDTQRTAPGPFNGVRLCFVNYDPGAPMTINRAAASRTASVTVAGGQYTAGPAGNGLDFWYPITFNGGSTSGTVPAAKTGVGALGTGTDGERSNMIPGILWSDFMHVASSDRADGSPLPFLRTRVHISDNAIMPNLLAAHVQAVNTVANAGITGGHIFLSGRTADTSANMLTNALAPTNAGGFVAPAHVMFYSPQMVRDLAAFGDSLTQGFKSVGEAMGWPNRLAAKYGSSNPDRLAFTAANWGSNGQLLEDSLSICRAYCAQHKPQFASFFAWSPNNSPAPSVMNKLWGQVLMTIQTLLELGITPVVLTSPPVYYLSSSDATSVRTQNARVMSLPNSVIKVDIAPALTEPSTLYAAVPLLATIYDADGVHFNDAGQEVVAQMVYEAIR